MASGAGEGSAPDHEGDPLRADLFTTAGLLHDMGRPMLVDDGFHERIVFLWNGEAVARQAQLVGDDAGAGEGAMTLDALLAEADATGAQGVVLNAEVWVAVRRPGGDASAGGAEYVRTEAFMTFAVHRDGRHRAWRTLVRRPDDDPDGTPELGPVRIDDATLPTTVLGPLLDRWAAERDAAA